MVKDTKKMGLSDPLLGLSVVFILNFLCFTVTVSLCTYMHALSSFELSLLLVLSGLFGLRQFPGEKLR